MEDSIVSDGNRRFTKEKILTSKKFSSIEKDILKAVLKADGKYSIDDAKKVIEDFSKKEAK